MTFSKALSDGLLINLAFGPKNNLFSQMDVFKVLFLEYMCTSSSFFRFIFTCMCNQSRI